MAGEKKFRATYRKAGTYWEGIVKDDAGNIVAACGHAHDCRDYNHSRFYQHKGAAMYCSKRLAWELNGRPTDAGLIMPECRGIPLRGPKALAIAEAA